MFATQPTPTVQWHLPHVCQSSHHLAQCHRCRSNQVCHCLRSTVLIHVQRTNTCMSLHCHDHSPETYYGLGIVALLDSDRDTAIKMGRKCTSVSPSYAPGYKLIADAELLNSMFIYKTHTHTHTHTQREREREREFASFG
jgi:hypothetical protein